MGAHDCICHLSAILVTSPPKMPSACTSVTYGMVHKDESQVKDANVASEHAGVKLLAACFVAQFAVHDTELVTSRTAAATAVSRCVGHRKSGARWFAGDAC